MDCPFCYNKGLVKAPEKYDHIPSETALQELEKRKKLIDGVVISGGEPTLYPEAAVEFAKKAKELGLLVKLDTNGLNPDVLEKLIPIVDYIAMDVKAGKKHYKDVTGVDADLEKIKKSIELLKTSGVKYEFRTTVVPEFIPEEEFEDLVELVAGAENFYIQQYRPVKDAGPLSKVYEPQILEKLAETAKTKVKNVHIRGI